MARIKKKPTLTVSGLGAPTMGEENKTLTATWTVPSAMTKSSNTARATNLNVDWVINMQSGQQKLSNTYAVSKTSVELNLDSFKIGDTTYNRNSFYPLNPNNKLTSVGITVTGKNAKGIGPEATQTRTFSAPPAPTIDEISFNKSNGICSTTVHAAESTEYKERYDTKYRVTIKTRTGSVINTSDSSSTSAEFPLQYDASDYMNLTHDQYIQVTVAAYSRGYAGDSKEVTRNFYISYPAKATITGTDVSAKDSTGKLTVGINTNKTTEHPIDKVTLEYLSNTTFEEASDITGRWEDAGIEDNADCTALAMPVENLIPDRGRFSWIRVMTMHAHDEVLVRYSEYVRLKALETPPAEAAEDTISILSAVSGAEGESAVVLLGWNRSGTDDSTGTELSWSDEEDTWKSTKEPENHEFTWSDGSLTHGGTTYHDSAEITIKGLSEGRKYYIRARRYYEGETTSYGRYSNTATVVTSEKPAGVVARCSNYIADGESLPVYWTFSGNGLQTEWQILAKQSITQTFTGNGSNKVFTVSSEVASVTSVKVNNTATSAYTRSGQTFTMNSAPANNASVVIVYDSFSTVVARGEGSIGGTQISAKRLSDLATNNSLTFNVQVSTGSGFVSSESKTVTILEKPTLSVTANATMTAQPYSFTASSSRLCDLIVIVTAQGASGQFPEGFRTQIAGDTIHSDVYSPAWNNGSATITLPKCDFWDLGSYTLSVVAVDRTTGLRSAEVTKNVKVSWARHAVDPDGFVTLTPIDETLDDESEHLQGVEIALRPPTGSLTTDVYDIYRMDGTAARLIGKGFPRTYTVIDRYAPFSMDEELYYRIALRTVDGDVKFIDVEYTLESETVRLDWQGGTLELPYGITIGDSYKKSVEFRSHMDGSVDGYWNPNIERTGSYSSAVIKLIQPEEINLARQLARYAGAVFVRTANGSAFPADVQVTDLSVRNKAVTQIAIDATEVGMTQEFMLPSPYEQEVN